MRRAAERVSLVTGGTDGIGRAVALQLARGGDRVLFVGRSAERGKQVLAELRKARPGVEHVFLPADLSLLSESARVAGEGSRHVGRLDAAVVCAGVLSTVPDAVLCQTQALQGSPLHSTELGGWVLAAKDKEAVR